MGLLLAASLAGELALEGDRRLLDHTLDNGLRVTILEDPRLSVVSTQHWVHVGSAQEQPEEYGFAHLFEHLMFGGTGTVDKETYGRLHTSVGGYENAYTSLDETVYLSLATPEVHDEVLRLEADRFADLAVTAENLANEQRIVTEELRLSSENDPFSRLATRAFDLLGDHPYGHPIVGTKADIAKADLALCQRFYDTWYRPNHVHLVIVGPVDAETTVDRVEALYGAMVSSEQPAADVPSVKTAPIPPVIELREDLPPVHVSAFAWFLPSASEDDVVLEVLLRAFLGSVNQFELQHVRRKRRALYADALWERARAGGAMGVFSVSLPFRSKKSTFTALRKTMTELDALAWLTPEVVAGVKRRLLRTELEQRFDADALAGAIGKAVWHGPGLEAWATRVERLEAVTHAEVVATWRRLFVEAEPIQVHVFRGKAR